MIILALESSATACSAALLNEGILLAQEYQNNGLTHSRTLLPMVQGMLENCAITLGQVDVIAVAVGPGSFTGLRIGVATAKGLAWAQDKDCVACSTLESMAWPLSFMQDAVIVAAMDARRNQVYNALFRARGETLERLTPDCAISLSELAAQLKNYDNLKIIVGDGAQLCYNAMIEENVPVTLAPEALRMQTAFGVAKAARAALACMPACKGCDLVPVYHRLSQAERERQQRQEQMKTSEGD